MTPDPDIGLQVPNSCRKCGGGLEPSQTYCLNCGSKAAGPRVPSGPVLEAIAVASLAAIHDGTNPPEASSTQASSPVAGPIGEGSIPTPSGEAGSLAGVAATGATATAAAGGSLVTLFASKSAASTGLALMVVGMIAGAAFSPPAPDAGAGRRVVIVQGAGTQATGPAAEPSTEPVTVADVTPLPETPVPSTTVPTTTTPTPPTPKTDPALGHVALVLLPGGGVGQAINSASAARAAGADRAHSADAQTWSTAFTDLKKKGLLLKGFKHNYGSGFANRIALLTGATPTDHMLATDDSAKPHGNKNEGVWEAKAYAKGVMVKHADKWYLAKLKAAADDEPGVEDLVWQEQTATTATEWSDASTDSTPTQGAYQKDYVVSYSVSGTAHYWRAKEATLPADVPGVSASWEDLGTGPYTGPQPIRAVGCAGEVPVVDASSGCVIPSGQDDLVSLITQQLASQDQAIRVYVDTPERDDSDYASLCHAPQAGETLSAAGSLTPTPLDNPVVWFRSLTGAPATPKLFKAKESTTSTDSPGVSLKWEAIDAWTYSGPQPADADKNKGQWDPATTYAVGDLVRHDHGHWWQAASVPTAADEPGKPANPDSPVWNKRDYTTATPWDAESTASSDTPGSFKKDYVVSTTSSGVTYYWQAKVDTVASDEPTASSVKWVRIGAQVYSGPQPGSGSHDQGQWSSSTSYVGSDLVQYLDGNWYRAKRAVGSGESETPGPSSEVWELQTDDTTTEWDSEARDADRAHPGSYGTGWVVTRPINGSSLCSGPEATGSIRPLSQMADDLRKAAAADSESFDPTLPSAYPKLTLIIPSRCRIDSSLTCEDGKTGGPNTLKDFLTENLVGTTDAPGISQSDIFTKDGFVVTAWDRPAANSDLAGGALVLSSFISPGKTSSKAYDIYSLTKTVQERFGIAGGAGMTPFIGQTEKATAFGRDVFPTR